MKSIFIYISLFLLCNLTLKAQINRDINSDRLGQINSQTSDRSAVGDQDGDTPSKQIPKSTIKHVVRNWILTDNYSRADSIPLDTLSQGFQIHNPAYRESMVNVQLGNLGAPWKSAMVSGMPIYTRFLFTENLSNCFTSPETWKYYNTRTPYTNLYYQYSGPKRRSEESVGILFTQNIRENWNAGFNYRLISSIGKYEAQKVDNRHFRFFSSYSGVKYQIHGSFVFNSTDHFENGGIVDEMNILNPENSEYSQAENIPVNLYSASNRTDNFQLFLNQSLNIGNLSIASRDGESTKLPVGTANHTLHIDRSRRIHKITELDRYLVDDPTSFFYPNIYADSTATRDSVYYVNIKNTFQLKFNEEANSFLRFGLRVFITNNIEKYKYPLSPVEYDLITKTPKYLQGDTTFTTTLIGAQIFKNQGEEFRWNAGIKLHLQGYRAGDSELKGEMTSRFRVKKDTAQLFANGGVFLVTPDFFTKRYYSNHITWNNNQFNPVKTIKIKGGITIPTRKLELSSEIRMINDYIYWDTEALPVQSSAYIKLIELRLFKHFKLGNFHSSNTLLYQISSDPAIVPLPEYSIYSSNYYQNTLFKVLFFQLGFDTRYTSAWYTPAYMPATGQFHLQKVRKIGDYPYVDVFLNMQLKRARIFIKMDHLSKGMLNNDYFHTIGYPVNPRGLRFGVSWNFYD